MGLFATAEIEASVMKAKRTGPDLLTVYIIFLSSSASIRSIYLMI